MAKSLVEWILELKDQFEQDELDKQVSRAKVTIGLVDPLTGQIQFHSLEYQAKDKEQREIVIKPI